MSGTGQANNAPEPVPATRVTGPEIVETLLQMGLLRREECDVEREKPPSLDTRAHRRFYSFRLDPFSVVVDYESDEPTILQAKAVNISNGGICFTVERAFNVGDLVRLDFAFPSQPIHYLIANVRHCNPNPTEQGFTVGAAFVS